VRAITIRVCPHEMAKRTSILGSGSCLWRPCSVNGQALAKAHNVLY
jgi:hypothetical protein